MRFRYGLTLSLCLITSLGSLASGRKKQRVRAELAELQANTGLTLVSVDYFGVDIVSFTKRSWLPVSALHNFKETDGFLSPDGDYLAFNYRAGNSLVSPSWLAIMQRDGVKGREYPEVQNPGHMCWSPDKSSLVLAAFTKAEPKKSGLILLDLLTGGIQPIEANALAETQCFSPDGKQLVYQAEFSVDKRGDHAKVKIYSPATGKSHELTSGLHPTWSPGGGIAYLDYDSRTYFLIGPADGVKRKLFKNSSAYSALWWSPDSRFVAYSVLCCFLKSLLYVADIGRLHVRRLEDQADDWVDEVSWNSGSYGWIQQARISPSNPRN